MSERRILVVGAGPVGLMLACELRAGGVPVRVVDRLPEPSPWSKAVAVHARTLEILRDLGIVERFLERGVRASGMTLLEAGQQLGALDFDGLETAYPFVLCIPQDATETILRERLSDLGSEVERGVELTGLTQHEDEAEAAFRYADGTTESETFSYVVGCDGGHSAVRSLLGERLEGSFAGATFLLADCDADHDLDRDRMYTALGQEGVAALFPLPASRVRLMAEMREPPPDGSEPTLADTQAVAERRFGVSFSLSSPRWLTYFEIHHGQVERYRVDRVFLAGDAAHVHSPAGGQGMNTGMQDAVNLAWKLRLAWLGIAAPGLLASYEAERRPVGAHVVRMTTRLTEAAVKGGAVGDRARRLLIPIVTGHEAFAGRVAGDLAELTVGYHDSPLVHGLPRRTSRGTLKPGDLAPDVGGLVDAYDPRVHTAVHIANDKGPGRSGDVAAILSANFGANVRNLLVAPARVEDDRFDDVLVDPDYAVASRFGSDEGLLALIRPDRYVAFLGAPEEVAAATRVLALAVG